MNVYSWWDLLFALVLLGALVLKIRNVWNGATEDIFWIVMIGLYIARSLYYALSREGHEERETEREKSKQASRELFGKWSTLVENAGLIPMLISVVWFLLAPEDGWPAGLLLGAGVIYTLVIGKFVKDHM